ncbi:hypothetical protein J5U21_00077 [Saccharolobus shibatae]|uniref:Uncharacterized protein n=1 Tax=Saccharolobus shibatae TaxID=2286 RepID=A0A8F5GVI5_9CREN|nr:hypothetical protein J5U21_p0077 [Saccharolobus shibatae]QXJ30437.1 hypothetical protein J5U21_00077 [Saccharolobus shibatae]
MKGGALHNILDALSKLLYASCKILDALDNL